MPIIGLLDAVWGRLAAEVGRGLAENGFVEGRDFRFSRPEHPADQLANAAELVKRQVALILAFSNSAALAAKTVTNTTPIIFLADDPVAAGLVDRLTEPGSNLTGLANSDSNWIAERIEIARELVPAMNLSFLLPIQPISRRTTLKSARPRLQPRRLAFSCRSLRWRVGMAWRPNSQRSRATARPCWSLVEACRSLLNTLISPTWLCSMGFPQFMDFERPQKRVAW
jgi:hypothetical protein